MWWFGVIQNTEEFCHERWETCGGLKPTMVPLSIQSNSLNMFGQETGPLLIATDDSLDTTGTAENLLFDLWQPRVLRCYFVGWTGEELGHTRLWWGLLSRRRSATRRGASYWYFGRFCSTAKGWLRSFLGGQGLWWRQSWSARSA